VVSYQAHSLELGAVSRAVVLGVVAEDGGAVEGAVVLGEVQPALEAVRALSSDTQPDDVGGTAAHRMVISSCDRCCEGGCSNRTKE